MNTLTSSSAALTRYERIYQVVQQIPYGKIATYGQVAELAGLFGQARQVGYALYRLAPGADIPWHRVINAKGQVSLSPFRNGTDVLQRELLEQEGIAFTQAEAIDLQVYLWRPTPLELSQFDAVSCEDLEHRAGRLLKG